MTTANKGIDEKLFSYLVNLLGNTPFYKFLGMKIRNIGQGESELFIDIEPHHENIIKGVHGGVIMALADAAMATSVRSLGHETSTVDFTNSFMRPATLDKPLLSKGRVVKQGKSLVFTEAVIYSGDKLVAREHATFFHGPDIELD